MIHRYFPEEPQKAVAVATCESNLNPKAVNKNNPNGTTDGGLMQINSSHDSRLKALGLNKFDPEDNLKFARILYDEQGWRPWSCNKLVAMK